VSASRFDVAVIGGGPAGAWSAYRLARGGARVVLLDGSHPREKPCGGGVTARAIALVRDGLDGRALPAVAIAGATFAYRDRSARCELRSDANAPGPLLVTSRREFDAALLACAANCGVDLVAARALDIESHAAGWTVRTRTAAIGADWLIGADGANSLVRRRVARAFDRHEISIASGYFVHGATGRDIDVEFVDDPPGYLWSFPRPDHLAVGVCGQADVTTAVALHARAARWIADHVESHAELERYSWPIPSLTAHALERERPSGDRWLLAGDAAGLVDPLTREGIYFALRSAEDAAASLLAGHDIARVYEARLRQTVFPELERAATLKARFFRSQFTTLLIAALVRSGAIRQIMADLIAGEQTYRGLRRRLLRTAEWRLVFELFGMR
jgi:geranylgeranyl reductase family protein